ncbi:MAG: DUF554 family protein [Aphanocapsa feldmannii 288cV]|nr:MAG: DUF554 family protein [Aphanocapsa feldmannii 288cV]
MLTAPILIHWLQATSGSWFNALAVLCGVLVGSCLGHRLPRDLRDQARGWLGLVTLVIGLRMAIGAAEDVSLSAAGLAIPAELLTLLSLVVGAALGHRLRLARRLEQWLQPMTAALQGPRSSATALDPGLLSGTFVLFCVGPLTLLGCLRNALLASPDLLLVKGSMDGLTAVLLSATYGPLVALVVVPLLLFQLGISSLALLFHGAVIADPSDPTLLISTVVGGVLVVGLAFQLAGLPHPAVTDALPSLLLVVLFTHLLALL